MPATKFKHFSPPAGYKRLQNGNYFRTVEFDGVGVVTLIRNPSGKLVSSHEGPRRMPRAYFTNPSDISCAEDIIRTICEAYSVSIADIESRSRLWELTWPRMLASYFLRRFTRLTYSKIGVLLDRTHCNVIKMVKSVRNIIEADPSLARKVSELEAYFKSNIEGHAH